MPTRSVPTSHGGSSSDATPRPDDPPRDSSLPLRVAWASTLDTVPAWTPPAVPTLVVVPHPDDEVLSTGALVAHQRAAGMHVTVLAVTDGGASHPEVDRGRLEARRREEQRAALADLGVTSADTVRGGFPDGEVACHERSLADAIADLASGCGLVVAPWERDHHSDHEACARAALAAARRRALPLVAGLFWAWHHETPASMRDVPLRSLRVAPSIRRRKLVAVDRHRSQFERSTDGPPVLTDALIEPVRWDDEYHVLAHGSIRG